MSNPRLTFLSSLMITVASCLSAAQQYTVTDLGTLSGGTRSKALAINNLGQVVGWSSQRHGGQLAFVWSSPTGMLELRYLNRRDHGATAYGLNDLGNVVGQSGSSPVMWTTHLDVQNLGSLGGDSGVAYGVNNLGQVVGYSTLSDNHTRHAFLWTSSTGMQDLGTLGGNTSVATAINDQGQVVGYSSVDGGNSHAFLWTEAGGMQDLGALGIQSSKAYGISANGRIAGEEVTPQKQTLAVLWNGEGSSEKLTNNPVLPTTALAVNTSGVAIGKASTCGFYWSEESGMQNMNLLIPPNGIQVSDALSINDAGQIAAFGSNSHAILMTPVN